MDNHVICAISRLMNEIQTRSRSLSEELGNFIYNKSLLDADIIKLNRYIQENINVPTPQKAKVQPPPA